MANFGIVKKDGTLVYFEHPCFAWVGDKVYSKVNREERAAYLGGVQFTNKADFQLILDSLLKSPMADAGVTFEEFDSEDFFIKVTLDENLPAWKYYQLLKMSLKTITYGGHICDKFVEALKQGANFQEAFILAKVNGQMAYNWPFITNMMPKDIEAMVGFITKGTMIDLTESAKKYAGYDTSVPFKDSPSFRGYCPDQPYSWTETNHYYQPTPKGAINITAKTVDELREQFWYKLEEVSHGDEALRSA